ncbi:winged helix-turn-helix domain-containing protein [Balneolales bacterium ANBcel1]|nr:winged helix-turn-helix domain-containing protein [Balneolales bacterium ANBcel1]
MLKFFTNSKNQGYLRGLAEEFGESTNAVRLELNRLSEANLITSETDGRKKVYMANKKHPLYPELKSVARKYLGLDRIQQVVERLGTVERALITGDYAKGIDSGIIDLVIVGSIDSGYLHKLVSKAEKLVDRKIRTLVLNEQEFKRFTKRLDQEKAIELWCSE